MQNNMKNNMQSNMQSNMRGLTGKRGLIVTGCLSKNNIEDKNDLIRTPICRTCENELNKTSKVR